MSMTVEDLQNAVVTFVNIAEEEVVSKEFEELDKNGVEILKALDELEEYRAIGTVSEFRELKEKKYDCDIKHLTGECSYAETGCSDCIGKLKIKEALEKATEIRAKAIEDSIEASAKAICIGCGYLDGHSCTYKGSNCGVSKPMLEVVVKALEQLKGE